MRVFSGLSLRVAAVSVALGASMAASASAAIVTVTPVSALWENVNPGGVAVDNSDALAPFMRWGTPVTGAGQSGYDFNLANTPVSVDVPPNSGPFSLGDLTHVNVPIFAGAGVLQSATLVINAMIEIEGVSLGLRTFRFDFEHDETPNAANPCADGSPNGVGVNDNGCADIVTVATSSLSETFIVEGLVYTLTVLGFSQDGGATIVSRFLTRENALNTAALLASVSVAEIPVPGALPLLLSGLAGFAALRRRRRTA